jgi:hypothetical protein
MMKYAHLCALLLLLVFCTAWKEQNKTGLPTDTNQSETKDINTSHRLTNMAANRANFSGEWKSKESISMGGNIVCVYDEGDRMRSRTMKIAEQADFLTIEIPNPSPGAALATSQEKLAFEGKESQINHGRERGKKFTVKWSADGQTMTVNSMVHLMIAQKQEFFYVTEVWKLSTDGKSISIQAHAKSTSWGEERSWKTVFDKANWYSRTYLYKPDSRISLVSSRG